MHGATAYWGCWPHVHLSSEENYYEYLAGLRVMCSQHLSSPPAIVDFLDRNCRYQSVITQIPCDAGMTSIPQTYRKFLPYRRLNQRRIHNMSSKQAVSLKPRDWPTSYDMNWKSLKKLMKIQLSQHFSKFRPTPMCMLALNTYCTLHTTIKKHRETKFTFISRRLFVFIVVLTQSD